MSYAPFTREEIKALTGMQAGAPCEDRYIDWLAELFAIYEKLRAQGKRPFDPADLPQAEHDAYWRDGVGAVGVAVSDESKPQPKGTAEAWMHEDDPTRVISAIQKAQAEKDGGASASSVKQYSIRLTRPAPAPAHDRVPMPQNADQAVGMVLLGEHWLREHAPERLKQAPAVVDGSPSADDAKRMAALAELNEKFGYALLTTNCGSWSCSVGIHPHGYGAIGKQTWQEAVDGVLAAAKGNVPIQET